MRFLALSLWLLAGNGFVEAVEPANGRVVRLDDSSQGDLAVAETAQGPWKVIRRGESLAADGFLRTSASGPCRLHIGAGTLLLAPETQAQMLTTRRRIVITDGRVFVQSLSEWTIGAGNVQATLSSSSALELEASNGDQVAG